MRPVPLRLPRWRSPFGTPEAGPAAARDRDAGRAVLEVVFGAVLLLIPTIYVLLTVFRFQAATLAVTQAARDAGRLIGTASDPATGLALARRAAVTALTDQQLPADRVTIRFTAPERSCDQGTEQLPALPPGAVVDVCVTAVVDLPGVPTVIGGGSNTVTGVYTLQVGRFREQG